MAFHRFLQKSGRVFSQSALHNPPRDRNRHNFFRPSHLYILIRHTVTLSMLQGLLLYHNYLSRMNPGNPYTLEPSSDLHGL